MTNVHKTVVRIAMLVACCSVTRAALSHVPDAGVAPPVTGTTLDRDRAALADGATRLYEITTRRRPLCARNATVVLTSENDVRFRIVYEPPEAGALRLRAVFLEGTEDGYGNAVSLAQRLPPATLGLRVLDRRNPALAVQVLGAAAPPPRRRRVDVRRAVRARRT